MLLIGPVIDRYARRRNEIMINLLTTRILSGIAATLLEGGRTAHSAFKLPLDLGRREDPTCNISRGSAKAKILRDCQLIIWDEATMSHKGAFEALDRTIQDIKRNNRVMGGMTVLLAGDFRQTLPVIQRGSRADEVKACLKSSHLWNKVWSSYFKQCNLITYF
jgi:ATP-dependent DNA helicase PIF1